MFAFSQVSNSRPGAPDQILYNEDSVRPPCPFNAQPGYPPTCRNSTGCAGLRFSGSFSTIAIRGLRERGFTLPASGDGRE